VALAVGRIAQKYRLLLEEGGDAKTVFYADAQMQKLTNILRDIGYEWELASINPMQNQYDIRLKKQGTSFLVGNASSGEKELLTYLFAIYALNVRDALIVVDEPELHLHPKWQSTLLSLFERLADETGNQFLLATHSTVFVSPSSIQYVSRVFSREQKSQVIRLDNQGLPHRKHLFSIINSQNNERIFFADLVILVEGISDRIFFEKVFLHLLGSTSSLISYDIVSVTGKTFFNSYKAVLDACKIRYVIIADLDYVTNVGADDVKQLFSVDKTAIARDAADPSSKDGATLVDRIEEAIQTKDFDGLEGLLNYVKSRRRKLRDDLSDSEKSILCRFIDEKEKEDIFILRKGSLEAYLPAGVRSKDLDKLIEFVDRDSFFSLLSEPSRTEMTELTSKIFSSFLPKRREGAVPDNDSSVVDNNF